MNNIKVNTKKQISIKVKLIRIKLVRGCFKFNPRVIDAIVSSFPIFITLFSNGTTRYSKYTIG